jgi:hypothetical protein
MILLRYPETNGGAYFRQRNSNPTGCRHRANRTGGRCSLEPTAGRDTVDAQDIPTTRSKAMPNRGQTQDQGRRGRTDPGTFPPDDDETAENEDNQRQAQQQQARRKQRDLPEQEGPEVESDDVDDESDDTSVSQ